VVRSMKLGTAESLVYFVEGLNKIRYCEQVARRLALAWAVHKNKPQTNRRFAPRAPLMLFPSPSATADV
jgi:hypothetical protein